MAKRDDIPKTDPPEIEALVKRLKQSNIEPHDAQLVERLLRLALSMASLLQHKNASIKRLRRSIFGPSSYKGFRRHGNETPLSAVSMRSPFHRVHQIERVGSHLRTEVLKPDRVLHASIQFVDRLRGT